MSSAVVIGAGLSGLTAARRLQQAGVEVTVCEREERVGGRVKTERHGEYLIDAGPDALTGSYTRYLALLDELGLADSVVVSSQVLGLVRDRRMIDIDPSRRVRAVLTPALSTAAKARLACGYLGLRKRLKGINAYELVQSADRDEPNVSAWELADRRFGREVTEYLADPLLRLVTGSGARSASVLGLLGALTSWTAPILSLRGGLQTVPDLLAASTPIIYGAAATRVEHSRDGVMVSYRDKDGRNATIEADVCVISAMFHQARTLWPELDARAPDLAAGLRDVKLISVSLGYRALATTRAYAVLVPTKESEELLLGFMQHNKAPDRAPAGHSLVTVYTDTAVTDRFLAQSDAEVEAWARAQVEALCPELTGHHDATHITRWPRAGYLATPGFWRWSRAALDSLSREPRIQLAGDLFGAGSMESSVRWGERAANRLLLTLGEPRTSARPRTIA